jgi:hypothetical protein
MKFFMIGPYYLNWHYTQGVVDLFKNLINFLSFEFHFFSVKELLLTLFAPFQRLKEDYGNNAIEFERILSAFVVNFIMRVVGFVVRSIILILAFVSIGITVILIPVLLLIWIVLPLILLILIGGSVWGFLTYKP